MIDVRVHTDGTGQRDDLALDEISNVLTQDETLLWVDLTDPSSDEFQLIEEKFGFHPLAMEDAARRHQRPKVEVYDGFLFMVFYELYLVDGHPTSSQLILFVGQNYLVTVHGDEMLTTIAETAQRWRDNVSSRGARHVGALVYSLLDAIVDSYFPVVDAFVDAIDDIEDRVFEHCDPAAQREIFTLKKELLEIRRVVAPQRDVINMLVRPDSQVFGDDMLVYFHHVSDHILRVTEAIDTHRELLTGALDAFLSVSSNRLNQVVKTLTSSSIILMTVTLIAGIYGMNFVHMPELNWQVGYPIALALMAVVGSGLFLTFRRMGWF